MYIGIVNGQSKKEEIFYLADTISLSPSNNILSIDIEYPLYGYIFHCRCIRVNKAFYVGFTYNIENTKVDTLSKLPVHKYSSWKELENMLYEKQENFDDHYVMYIIEKLPMGKFKENKVKLHLPKRTVTQ